MKKTQLFIVIGFISVFFSNTYGATPQVLKYNKEEIKALNQIVYELIDAERLSSFNKTPRPLIYAFDTKLICNLDEINFLSYKTNYLIQKLKRKGIPDRTIDSISIRKFEKAKFIFFDNDTLTTRIKEFENYSGRLSLSRISFNKSLSVGYLLYCVYVDSDAGWGGLIRIEKRNGKWKIIGGPMYVM